MTTGPRPGVRAEQLLQHRDFVRRLARVLTHDESTLDDIEQETWVAGLSGVPARPDSLAAWLATIVRRIAARAARSEHRRRERERRAARREALPSTLSAVERITIQQQVVEAVLALREPFQSAVLLRYYDERTPRQIAAAQGLKVSTVKSRLRRGTAELRRRLQQRGAAGPDWLAGLVVLAGPPRRASHWPAVPATLADAASKPLLALVVLAAGLLLWVARWDFAPAALPAAEATSSAAASAGSAGEPGGSSGTAAAARTARAGALPGDGAWVGGAAQREPLASAMSRPAEPGQVRFEVVSARTGAAIEEFEIRLLGTSRFATSSEHTLLLTPDSYEFVVEARGYETSAASSFVLHAGEDLDLGVLELQPGGGMILGRITGSALQGDDRVEVRVVGDGRGVCLACALKALQPEVSVEAFAEGEGQDADPEGICRDCAYGEDYSWRRLRPGDEFRFPHLASGYYLVEAHVERLQPFIARQLAAVNPLGTTYTELRLDETRFLELELFEEDGRPYVGHAEIRENVWRQRPSLWFRFYDGEDRVADGSPPVTLIKNPMLVATGNITFQTTVSFRGSIHVEWPARGSEESRRPAPIDRGREPGDTLRTEREAPPLPPIALQFETDANHYKIGPLPPIMLRGVIEGPARRSDPFFVDLRFDPGYPRPVVLHPVEPADDRVDLASLPLQGEVFLSLRTMSQGEWADLSTITDDGTDWISVQETGALLANRIEFLTLPGGAEGDPR